MANITAVGVSFANPDGTNRQELIKLLNVGDFVRFVEEPTNPRDAKAIAIVNDNGETLGYIGSTDPMRELVRRAMKYDNFMATIADIPGRYPEAKKTYTQGLRIAVGNVIKDGDDEPDFAPLFTRQGKRRTDRWYLDRLHKVDDIRDLKCTKMEKVTDPTYRRLLSKQRRRAFKEGWELKPNHQSWVYNYRLSDKEMLERFYTRRDTPDWMVWDWLENA